MERNPKQEANTGERMCRPRSQIDEEQETPVVSVSHAMPSDKGSQILAESQRSSYDENNFFLVDASDEFDPQPSLDKIEPFGMSSVDFPISVPTHKKSRNQDSKTTLTVNRKVNTEKNGKTHRPVIVVQHNYHDYSQEAETMHPFVQTKPRGGVSVPFPQKLHDMLDKAMADGYGDIISWQPHGRCFVVYKSKEFQDTVLPKYFKLSKLASFQRQLNLYGFQRLTFGRDRGGYYHERFLRHKRFLARGIKRVQVKGTGVRARSNPDQEPNFWTMTWCNPNITDKKSKKCERGPSSSTSMIDDSGNGMPSTWNASSNRYQQNLSNSGQQEQSNIWTSEMRDPKIELLAPPTHRENGTQYPRTVGDSIRGVLVSTTQRDGFSSCQEPIDVSHIEWCDSKCTSSMSNQGSRHTMNKQSSDANNLVMPSSWHDAPIYLENCRSYESIVTLPTELEPIQMRERQGVPPVSFRDASPDHNNMNVTWKNVSYGGESILSCARAENRNLVSSFYNNKAHHCMNRPLQTTSEELNANSTSNGVVTMSLFSRTFEHQA